MAKHGYTSKKIDKMVNDAYQSGVTTAHKISKIIGIHYKTAQASMFRQNLVDQSRSNNKKSGYYVYTNKRGDQTIYAFDSIYQAVKYFKSLIPQFYSTSHATKLFTQAQARTYIYNTPEHKILYYGPTETGYKKYLNDDNTIDFLPED